TACTSCPLPLIYFVCLPHPPRSTLFPYTTLFRSRRGAIHVGRNHEGAVAMLRKPFGELAGGGGFAGALQAHDHPHGRRLGGKERSEEHTSELQSLAYLVCRLLLEKKNETILGANC